MRRKDGKPKRRALRSMPTFEYGFRDNPSVIPISHPSCQGIHTLSNWKVTSLFAGCGGFDLSFLGGFTYMGKHYPILPFDIIDAADNLSDAVECYRLNIGEHCRNADLTSFPINQLHQADVLIGGFPCQDFSSSGPKTGFEGRRGRLYKVLTEYMTEYRPKVVVAENVPYLARLGNGKFLQTILSEFEGEGYHFDVWEMYGPDYGLSQSRRRIFLVGLRDDLAGFPVKPLPTHASAYIPIAKALGDLEAISDESIPNQSQYFIASRATSGGGQGDHINDANDVAYCIRANSRGRIQFHYKLERRLTVRECARLQSFPDEFVFPFTTQRNLTLIGNAVPPILGYRVAESVANYLESDRNGKLPKTSEPGISERPVVKMVRDYGQQAELFSS